MRMQRRRILPAVASVLAALLTGAAATEGKAPPSSSELVRIAVRELVKAQEAGGQWPYEGSARVYGGLPVGFRVAGTSIVAQTLLLAAPQDENAQAAVQRALVFVLQHLDHPWMAPSVEDRYDVRVWGHGFALEFLCHVRAGKVAGKYEKEVAAWIPRLVEALIRGEIPGGGWHYAYRRPAPFVTAPITQALLLARAQGEKVPDELFERSRKVLTASRTKDGGCSYAGDGKTGLINALPGSTCRALACETTLVLLRGGSIDAVQFVLNAFFEHWNKLEQNRKRPGTHDDGSDGIAPYYFYYGHRYAAQAIQLLPEEKRAKERERLLEAILKTRDADGTWNDRAYWRGRCYGTSMAVLALLGDKAPLPPRSAKP